MKVLCIYPNLEGYGRVPLGYCLIITYLLNAGHEVELFDTTFIGDKGNVDKIIRENAKLVPLKLDISNLYHPHTRDEVDVMLATKVREFKPDLVAMTIVEDNYRYGHRLLRVVKSVSNAPILVGGSTPTAVPDIVIENPYIDYLCEGEGEGFIVEFCDLLSKGKSVEDVRNLWYKKNNIIRHNSLRPFIDMDSLPTQRLDLWDGGHFVKPYDRKLYKTGSFEMSRGCPNKCSYCINELLQITLKDCGKYRRDKSVGKTIEEIKYQKEKYGFELIFFADDNFLLISNAKLSEFVEAWNKEIKLPYWINTHLHQINEFTLAKLKESGCCGIGVGLESGSERLREEVLHRRDGTNEDIANKIKLIMESGIRVTVNSMIGFPTETEADIFDTIKLNKMIKPDSMDLNFVAPYAGTALHACALKKGYIDAYANGGFRGLAKDITVRKHPVMKLPQINKCRLNQIFYNFTDYVYDKKEIPAEFR